MIYPPLSHIEIGLKSIKRQRDCYKITKQHRLERAGESRLGESPKSAIEERHVLIMSVNIN